MPFSCFLFLPRKSRERRRKRSHTNVSNASVIRFSTPPAQTPHVRFHGQKWVHARLCSKDRTQRLARRNRGHFGWGAIITLDTNCTFTNIPGPGIRTANFAAFEPWSGVLPKNAESLRDSDALMRVAVPRRRGPAGLRDLFCFCRNCGLYALRSVLSACMGQGWYHYSRCVPHAAETPGPRLSKRLTCRFLVSPIYICESPRRMQPISASIQIACCWISRGHIACPWLIQA